MSETFKNGAARHNGPDTVRFADFEADLYLGEVRKSGSRIKLQEQPFKVLQILLERPGDLVTRDELRSRIWPEESYGDFDHAVNVAVAKLRTALGDSAESPCFVETIPRRGYRFVAPLNGHDTIGPPGGPPPVQESQPHAGRSGARRIRLTLVGAAVAAAILATGFMVGRGTARPIAAEFQRVTARHGTVYSARFAPDGHNVIYSAAWDGLPIEVFETDVNFAGTRSLGLLGDSVLAVSSTGQMAVVQSAKRRMMLTLDGTLGELPLTGGSPRSLAENVEWADWAPDGTRMAIVRNTHGTERLEFPVGHVLYETNGWISHPRISPTHDQVAFLDHPSGEDDRGFVAVVDLNGARKVLSTGWESEEGLAWSPDGKQVLFSATRAGLQRRIYSVDLAGNLRLRYSAPAGVTLQDIAADGRMLLTRDDPRSGIMALASGAKQERNLSWLDWSLPVDISSDGNLVLFDEQGEQAGPSYTVATRDMQGSAPVPLGEGMAGGFSPDGKWVVATVDYTQIVLLPTGAGTTRRVDPAGIQSYGHPVKFLPDGKRLIFPAREPGHTARCYVQSVDGGKPRAITPEGITYCSPSPDGKWVAAKDSSVNAGRLYPVDGGAPRDIAGLAPGEAFSWSADPNYLYVHQGKDIPFKIYRLDITTGKREFFRELNPMDMTGVCDLTNVMVSADGRAYVYGFTRQLSDLYLVKGLP